MRMIKQLGSKQNEELFTVFCADGQVAQGGPLVSEIGPGCNAMDLPSSVGRGEVTRGLCKPSRRKGYLCMRL